MSDIEQAYRTLGLETGASFKEVMEAHRDLAVVWDPKRFQNNPRLQKKATENLNLINAAFESLRAYHLGAQKGEALQQPFSRDEPEVEPTGKTKAAESEGRAPSLYQEIFIERIGRRKNQIPIWFIVAPIVALLIVVSYWGGPADEDKAQPSKSAQSVKEPSAAESLLEETKNTPGGLQSRAPSAGGPMGESEAAVETAPDISKPASSSSQPAPGSTLKNASVSQQVPKSSSEAEALKTEVPAVERKPDQSKRPVLERETLVSNEEAESPTSREVQEEERWQRAFQMLREKSVVANKLIEGEVVVDLSYHEWKTVRENAPEFWVDLIAYRSTDREELHLIWSVNTDTGVIIALSQAARDLESKLLPGARDSH
ncbi:hypothetical protein MYX82_00660 [Acidobacteria bacterium AH-259-D05]|nr:hypothetical protein [Acidobacteria bacterium AH-259-D05]